LRLARSGDGDGQRLVRWIAHEKRNPPVRCLHNNRIAARPLARLVLLGRGRIRPTLNASLYSRPKYPTLHTICRLERESVCARGISNKNPTPPIPCPEIFHRVRADNGRDAGRQGTREGASGPKLAQWTNVELAGWPAGSSEHVSLSIDHGFAPAPPARQAAPRLPLRAVNIHHPRNLIRRSCSIPALRPATHSSRKRGRDRQKDIYIYPYLCACIYTRMYMYIYNPVYIYAQPIQNSLFGPRCG